MLATEVAHVFGMFWVCAVIGSWAFVGWVVSKSSQSEQEANSRTSNKFAGLTWCLAGIFRLGVEPAWWHTHTTC